jgi:hypothetical protein
MVPYSNSPMQVLLLFAFARCLLEAEKMRTPPEWPLLTDTRF